MELRSFSASSCAGDVFHRLRHHILRSNKGYMCALSNNKGPWEKKVKLVKAYSTLNKRSVICCLSSPENNPCVPSEVELLSGKVIYSVAAAMGHNKDSHPECNSRVPAIISALGKMGLTTEFRGSEIIELKEFRAATVDDVVSVHDKAYVSGLEKAVNQASEQGLIFIEGSGPTYATSMTFEESLSAAGAGLSLVDAVVMSRSKALVT